jgi:acetyltransferase-like isoleucine patch superfamily enzyme
LGPTHPVILCTWQAGAAIEIGENFAMTGGSLVAAERISIGNYVNIGANSTVIDTNFHPLDAKARRETPQIAETAPITIQDGVFIGMNCLILKGVTIGQNSVIGAGSVVTRDIPANVIAAGNPAKAIKNL